MSRSKRWHQDWSFYLGQTGRRQYHPTCQCCLNNCKQSYRVDFLFCPKYHSKLTKKHRN